MSEDKKDETATSIFFRQSKRVGLRLPTKDDIPKFLEWFNDPEVLQFLANAMPKTLAEEEEWLERTLKSSGDHVFVIVAKEANKAIGTVGIHSINWRNRNATTGLVIGEKDCWEQGYGTEVARLVGDFAFGTLNLRKLCSSVLATNKRSHRLQLSSGGQEEGRKRQQLFVNGEYVDEILLAFFQEDWLRSQ